MYVAEVPNRNSPPAILLRESYRENGKVKNRTLANLSSWPSSRVEALRRLLRGELDDAAVSDPTMGPTFGVLHALKHVAAVIGIGPALGQSRNGKLELFLVLARVAHLFFIAATETPSFGVSYVAPMALLNALVAECANVRRSQTLKLLREVDAEQRSGSRWYLDEPD